MFLLEDEWRGWLKEKGLTMSRASRLLGRNPAYLNTRRIRFGENNSFSKEFVGKIEKALEEEKNAPKISPRIHIIEEKPRAENLSKELKDKKDNKINKTMVIITEDSSVLENLLNNFGK